MVLEALFNPFIVKKRPWEMFFAGFLYSVVGLFLSYFVFKEIAGILMVFLIVMASIPMLYTTVKNEEELNMKYDREWFLLREHTKVLIFLIFLFLGITFALVAAYIFLPQSVTSTVFNLQEQAIQNVNSYVQSNITGGVTRLTLFTRIFINNLKVLFFCVIFSLLYGTGAMFILTWNASVIAAAMGNLIKLELAKAASLAGWSGATAYFGAATFSFFRYMTHGFFEIAAYFIAGLAGGIISIALIKHNLQNERVFIDALDLILISLGILLLGSVVEVYVTPMLFL
ncbi:stage II sporulation protein M [Candidatus Woesearchaeota archaeon]|nr:stage II sporulation protein M [Candidatus Woesearchaeota archaeon]